MFQIFKKLIKIFSKEDVHRDEAQEFLKPEVSLSDTFTPLNLKGKPKELIWRELDSKITFVEKQFSLPNSWNIKRIKRELILIEHYFFLFGHQSSLKKRLDRALSSALANFKESFDRISNDAILERLFVFIALSESELCCDRSIKETILQLILKNDTICLVDEIQNFIVNNIYSIPDDQIPPLAPKFRESLIVEKGHSGEVAPESGSMKLAFNLLNKKIQNTLLSYHYNDSFSWAYLNLARLETDEIDSGEDQYDYLDKNKYITWLLGHVEENVLGESVVDILLLAQVRFVAQEYQRVVNVLETKNFNEESYEKRRVLLLATSYARLYLKIENEEYKKSSYRYFTNPILDKISLPIIDMLFYIEMLFEYNDHDKAQLKLFQMKLTDVIGKSEISTVFIRLCARMDQLQFAEPAIKKILENEKILSSNEIIEFLTYLCHIYRFSINQFNDSRKIMERIQKISPNHFLSRILECEKALEKEDFKKAELLIKSLTLNEFWNIERLLFQLRLALHRNDYVSSKFLLDKVPEQKQNRADWLYYNACVMAHEGQIANSRESILSLDSMEEWREKIDFFKAKLFIAEGEYNAALNLLKRIKLTGVLELKSYVYYKLENYKKSLKLARESISEEQCSGLAYFLNGRSLESLNRTDEAITTYLDALSQIPGESYFKEIAFRFVNLVIRNKSEKYAKVILQRKDLYESLQKDQKIEILQILNDWQKISLILKDDYSNINNYEYVYLQLLIDSVRSKQFSDGHKYLEAMKSKNIDIKIYNEFLLRAEFYHSLGNNEKAIDEKFNECEDPHIQLSILLSRYLEGLESIENIQLFISDWNDFENNSLEINAILLLIHLLGNSWEPVENFKTLIGEQLQKVNDADKRNFARFILALVDEKNHHHILDNIEGLLKLRERIPTNLSFIWQKTLVSLINKNDYENAVQLLRNDKVELDVSTKAKKDLYLMAAAQSLKKNDKLINTENYLKKAVELN